MTILFVGSCQRSVFQAIWRYVPNWASHDVVTQTHDHTYNFDHNKVFYKVATTKLHKTFSRKISLKKLTLKKRVTEESLIQ